MPLMTTPPRQPVQYDTAELRSQSYGVVVAPAASYEDALVEQFSPEAARFARGSKQWRAAIRSAIADLETRLGKPRDRVTVLQHMRDILNVGQPTSATYLRKFETLHAVDPFEMRPKGN
jgi:hypothetical protein